MKVHVCDLLRFVKDRSESGREIVLPFATSGVLEIRAEDKGGKISVQGDTLYLRTILEGDLDAGLKTESEYWVDEEKREHLLAMLGSLHRFNAMYAKGKTHLEVCKPASNAHGILQVDVSFQPSAWVQEFFSQEWNLLENPGVYTHGVRFGDSGTSMRVLNETLAEFFAHPSGKWKKVFPRQLYISEEGNLINGWQDFLSGRFQTGILFIEEDERHFAHTVYLWVDNHHVTLYDPRGLSKEQESLRILQDRLGGQGLTFVWKQKLEQGKEGSCGYFSVARALLLAERGEASLQEPIPRDYLYLVGRMIKEHKDR